MLMARFVRKHPGAGVYQAAFRERPDGSLDHIKIENRDVFETDDKKTIEFLRNDPEVVEFTGETTIESKE